MACAQKISQTWSVGGSSEPDILETGEITPILGGREFEKLECESRRRVTDGFSGLTGDSIKNCFALQKVLAPRY